MTKNSVIQRHDSKVHCFSSHHVRHHQLVLYMKYKIVPPACIQPARHSSSVGFGSINSFHLFVHWKFLDRGHLCTIYTPYSTLQTARGPDQTRLTPVSLNDSIYLRRHGYGHAPARTYQLIVDYNDCASTLTIYLLYSLNKMIRQATLSLRKRGVRAFNSASLAPATLPELNYDYAALEPVISGQIMEIHHSKHHNAYVTNYNIAAEAYADAQAKNDTAAMIGLQGAIKFNGGGHVNHSIFWTNLAPRNAGGGTPPTGDLLAQIEGKWGSLNVSTVLRPCSNEAITLFIDA